MFIRKPEAQTGSDELAAALAAVACDAQELSGQPVLLPLRPTRAESLRLPRRGRSVTQEPTPISTLPTRRLTRSLIPRRERGGTPQHARVPQARGWLSRGFFYLWDEPPTRRNTLRFGMAAKVHALAPEARVLTTYYCGPSMARRRTPFPESLRGATQIFCLSQYATSGEDPDRTAMPLQRANSGGYNVCCGPVPAAEPVHGARRTSTAR